MKTINRLLIAGLALFSTGLASASLVIPIFLTTPNGDGQEIGEVIADDTIYGLILTPKLHGLPPGIHGFHVHAMASCEHDGMMAGGHLDPDKFGKHVGPYDGNGHLGDLPVLIVDAKGNATIPVLAPRLKLYYIKNHALMIHAGSDNYSDVPRKLGGGGERIACGKIPYYS
ncbi:MAG: superoxide dismutase [Cu-Zn] SodC [Pseudomonadota bacterium]